MILIRAAEFYRKVSHFSDGLVQHCCPSRHREGVCGGVQVQRHPFCTVALDGVSSQDRVVSAVLLGKYPRYPLNRKPIGSQSRSGESGKVVNL